MSAAKDPVHYKDGLWWFWDETWGGRHGPFLTEDSARAHLADYGAALTDGEVAP